MSELRNAFERRDLNEYVNFVCRKCGFELWVREYDMDDEKVDQELRDHLLLFCIKPDEGK